MILLVTSNLNFSLWPLAYMARLKSLRVEMLQEKSLDKQLFRILRSPSLIKIDLLTFVGIEEVPVKTNLLAIGF